LGNCYKNMSAKACGRTCGTMVHRAFAGEFVNSRSHGSNMWRRLCRLPSCGGFTLVELIVIIVLVGLLGAVVGMKSGFSTSSANLRVALDQIAADLRFLQSQSMATMACTGGNTVSFPGGGNSYLLPMALPQGTTCLVQGQWKTLPSGVTISNGLTVTFNSLGEYNTTTDATLTLNSQGKTGTVKIYANSGDVEAY